MKKLILPLFITLFSFQYAQAQCVPGTETKPQAGYIIPDSAANLKIACAGQPYEQIIYIKAPKDTQVTAPGIPAPVNARIDSFVVDVNIVGLPPYLTVETVPAPTPAAPGTPKSNYDRLIIKGDSMACMRISGNVPAGVSGVNPLTIGVRAYLFAMNLIPMDTLANIGYYHLDVMNPCWPAGVQELEKNHFNITEIAPNPTSNITNITFMSNTAEEYEYRILSSLGQIVESKKIAAIDGMNRISVDMAHLSNGFYLFTLTNGRNIISKKLQVSK